MSVNTGAASTLFPDRESVPASLSDILDVVGLNATETLVKLFGGTRVFVPKTIQEGHRVAQAIGLRSARKLARHMGGGTVTFVKGDVALRKARNKAIVEAYKQGTRVRELARAFALTERRIYSILSEQEL